MPWQSIVAYDIDTDDPTSCPFCDRLTGATRADAWAECDDCGAEYRDGGWLSKPALDRLITEAEKQGDEHGGAKDSRAVG